MLSLFAASSTGFTPVLPMRSTTVQSRGGMTRAGEPIESEDERREKLRQLFGEQTADKLVPQKKAEPEFLMLVEGMQMLEWGETRLIDVAMAPGPLELSLQPILPAGTSKLLCARLDLPLGMLLEEDDVDPEATVPGLGPQLLRVAELYDSGTAADGGVRVGDLVRGTTFVTMGMSYPTWQLALGGVGRPTLQKRALASPAHHHAIF